VKQHLPKILLGFAAILTAASASADVTYDLTGSGFDTTGDPFAISADQLDPSSGFTSNFTLDYSLPSGGAANTITSFPSNISYGNLTLDCIGCTTPGTVYSANFSAFTIDIMIDDTTDGAVGEFVGTSTGGSVSYCLSSCPGGLTNVGSSNVSIAWSPVTLSGPGSVSGNFGNTQFNITTPTGVVDPTTNAGVSSIQGSVTTQVSGTPEPATLAMMGGGLLVLGLISKKRRA
jgi:hypothetical protein